MSVAGELYRSYDSFVDGRMYQSMGSEGSVGLHQANQFIQSFGGYGHHVPQHMHMPRLAGIGMRIERNAMMEFYVAIVNKNGSADRDGTIRVGDILVAVDGQPVFGLPRTQSLRPLIMGQKGTYVKLSMKRYLQGDDGYQEFTEFTLDLIRGDSLFFLEGENKAVGMKIQELRRQLLEVEVEMDSMRAVLKQAENGSRIDQREVEGIQQRYQNIQSVIEKCNAQIMQEKQLQQTHKNFLEGPDGSTEQNKLAVRQYHENLTRVEVQLSQVMADLEQEQTRQWELSETTERENRVLEMMHQRLSQQSAYAQAQEEQSVAERERLQQLNQAHTLEISRIKAQLEQLRARPKTEDTQEVEQRVSMAEADVSEAKKETQRMQMKLQMVQQVLNALKDEDKRANEVRRSLETKQRQTVSVTQDNEKAIANAQQAMEQYNGRWSAAYQQKQDERQQARREAEDRREELKAKILALKEQNVAMQGQANDVLFRMESKQQEMVSKMGSLSTRLQHRQADTRHLQTAAESTAHRLQEAQDETALCIQENAALVAQERKLTTAAEASKMRLESLEMEMAADIKKEDARAAMAHALVAEQKEMEGAMEQELQYLTSESDAIEGEVQASEDEIKRCKDAIDKLVHHQRTQLERQTAFRELHMRSIAKTQDGLLHAHNDMRQILQNVGTLSGDIIFTSSREASSSIVNSIHLLDLMHGEVFARRQREATRAASEIAALSGASVPPSAYSPHRADPLDWQLSGASARSISDNHAFPLTDFLKPPSSHASLTRSLTDLRDPLRRRSITDVSARPITDPVFGSTPPSSKMSGGMYADEMLRQHLKERAFSPHKWPAAPPSTYTPPRENRFSPTRDLYPDRERRSPPRGLSPSRDVSRDSSSRYSPSRDLARDSSSRYSPSRDRDSRLSPVRDRPRDLSRDSARDSSRYSPSRDLPRDSSSRYSPSRDPARDLARDSRLSPLRDRPRDSSRYSPPRDSRPSPPRDTSRELRYSASRDPSRDSTKYSPSRDSRYSPSRDPSRDSTKYSPSRDSRYSPSRDGATSHAPSLFSHSREVSRGSSPNGASAAPSLVGSISSKQAHERRVEHMASLM